MRSVRRVAACRWLTGATASLAAVLVLAVPAPALAVTVQPTVTVSDQQYWLDDYGIRAAWEMTRGAGVTVAVIDTGIDGSHPDLAGVIVDGTDVSGIGAENGQQPVGATSYHGTLVASLLAGRGVDGGVIGVAPEASLLSVSMAFGPGFDTDDQVARGIRWAVDHGASVINMSLTRGSLDWPTSWDDAFSYAMEHDVVIVAAAGNRSSGTNEVGAPATMPGVLTVAGLDVNGNASWDASSQGITIGVSAPSELLVGAYPGGGYTVWQGTSGATPLVSGLVALVRAQYPELDAANVINRVIETATRVGDPVPNSTYGYGRINAEQALSAAVPRVSANPMGSLEDWIRLYRPVDPAQLPTIIGGPVTVSASALPPPVVSSAAAVVTRPQAASQLPAVIWVGLFLTLAVWGYFVARYLRTRSVQQDYNS